MAEFDHHYLLLGYENRTVEIRDVPTFDVKWSDKLDNYTIKDITFLKGEDNDSFYLAILGQKES